MSNKSDLCTASNLHEGLSDNPIKVLLVDDHVDLVANIYAYLEHKNFIVDAAQDGASALQLSLVNHYDVLVLDWMMPKLSGIDMLAELRKTGSDLPVIMLTARAELPDKLAGFSTGADDYLTKPFSLAELEARLIALHTRKVGRQKIMQVADLSYNLPTQTVMRNGQVLHLHDGSKKLLVLLMKESPAAVSKERLETALWGDNLPDKDLLRTHIYELRKRIDHGFPEKLLHTIPKFGYQLISMMARSE